MEGLRSFWASNGNGLGVVTAILTSDIGRRIRVRDYELEVVSCGLGFKFSMFEFQCQHSGSSPRKECVHW